MGHEGKDPCVVEGLGLHPLVRALVGVEHVAGVGDGAAGGDVAVLALEAAAHQGGVAVGVAVEDEAAAAEPGVGLQAQ